MVRTIRLSKVIESPNMLENSQINIFFFLVLCHLASDYLLQNDKIGSKKYGLNLYMFEHIAITGLVTLIPLFFFRFSQAQILFAASTICASHYLIDIARAYINRHFHLNGDMSPYWKLLGVDQILHLLTIYFVIINIL